MTLRESKQRVLEALCKRGATLAEIGREIGCTREWVRQIMTPRQARIRKEQREVRLREREFWSLVDKLKSTERGRWRMAIVVRLQSQCGLDVRWAPDGSLSLYGKPLHVLRPQAASPVTRTMPELRYYRVGHSAGWWYVDVLPDGRAYLHEPRSKWTQVYYREDRSEMRRRRNGVQARLLWADDVARRRAA